MEGCSIKVLRVEIIEVTLEQSYEVSEGISWVDIKGKVIPGRWNNIRQGRPNHRSISSVLEEQ